MIAVKNNFADKLIPVSFSFDKNFAGFINIDDYEMAATALYKINYNEYLMDIKTHPYRKDSVIISAVRPRFNVWLHVMYLKLYMRNSGLTFKNANQIPANYFYIYGLIICIIKSFLFIISAFYFLSLLLLFFNKGWSIAGSFFYILFPPVFFYIGILEIFENISMPILVIVFAFIYQCVYLKKEASFLQIFSYAALASFSCLLRPQTLFIFLIFLVLYLLIWIFNLIKHKTFLTQSRFVFIAALIVFIVHLPILVANHKKFGAWFLSTQSSSEFLQGHNTYARGSWYYGLVSVHAKDFAFLFNKEPGLSNLDEKQEMDIYFEAGKNWMLHHPKEEAILTARKTALYFLPTNYLNHIFNPVNLIVYIGTIGFLFFSLYRRIKNASINELLQLAIILTPLIGSYLLTIIYFMGERWRYYAEPFMIIYALIFFKDMIGNFYQRITN
ncbi:MAG: hypothetical protein ABI723_23980 [Bacteroidia bacterium]